MDGMLPNRHGYHWEKNKEFIVFDDMHILKVSTDHD